MASQAILESPLGSGNVLGEFTWQLQGGVSNGKTILE